ncbi:ATP-binding protein [Nocardioides jishulii]|uniref:ATP-binding protein n=1 Tax=Nocardioides jishulii TaxID=2575440 RepID=A0A4V5TM03_9ACTN|nr:ATP-binding protein [Nocardioides jishulii]TKI63783.1 ATP-binding protein [Nocardioides jishulii]
MGLSSACPSHIPDRRGPQVPLNKEALPLDASPSSVAAARRWVVTVCEELGRDDLVECAELGVSELVTNAILHGEAPLSVRVRGTVHHPRIEVYDGSRRPPVLPSDPFREHVDHDDDDALLTTNGRGLALVAMSSTAWGASVELRGKVVWFEPARAVHDRYPPGIIDGVEDPDSDWTPLPDSMTVKLLDVDVPLFLSTITQYSNLRRELRLLALSHDHDYPLAGDLSQMFATFERQFPPSSLHSVSAALLKSGDRTDLSFQASPRSSQVFRTMYDMFELADSFCRNQRLLSLARTPEQVELQGWLLTEFLRQADGQEPTAWSARANDHAHAS